MLCEHNFNKEVSKILSAEFEGNPDILDIIHTLENPSRFKHLTKNVPGFLTRIKNNYDRWIIEELLIYISRNMDNNFLIENYILLVSKKPFSINDTYLKLSWIKLIVDSHKDFIKALRHAGYLCPYKIKEISEIPYDTF